MKRRIEMKTIGLIMAVVLLAAFRPVDAAIVCDFDQDLNANFATSGVVAPSVFETDWETYQAERDSENGYIYAGCKILQGGKLVYDVQNGNVLGGRGTLELWLKPNSVPSTDTRIVKIVNSVSGGIDLVYEPGPPARFQVVNWDANITLLSHVISFEANKWTHLAVTWDSVGGSMYFYKDGAFKGAVRTTGWTPGIPWRLCVPDRGPGVGIYDTVFVDGLVVTDTVKSASEISAVAGVNRVVLPIAISNVTDLQSALDAKANATDVYTINEIDTLLGYKADVDHGHPWSTDDHIHLYLSGRGEGHNNALALTGSADGETPPVSPRNMPTTP